MAKQQQVNSVASGPAKALFIQNEAIPEMTPLDGMNYVDVGFEICEAMTEVCNVKYSDINGATKISGLWRLGLKGPNSHLARASILASGLELRGHMIPVLSKNPFHINGEESNRLVISNLPFSVSNDALKGALIDLGLQLGSSEIKWEMYKDSKRNLTGFKNGKRVIHIAPPKQALPKKIKVAGKFDAFLSYKGPLPKDDILLKKQAEIRNQPDYSPDSDSESELDDNDQILKGIQSIKKAPNAKYFPVGHPRTSSPINRSTSGPNKGIVQGVEQQSLIHENSAAKEEKIKAFAKLFDSRSRNAERLEGKLVRTRSCSLTKRKLTSVAAFKKKAKKQKKTKKVSQGNDMSDSNNNASSFTSPKASDTLVGDPQLQRSDNSDPPANGDSSDSQNNQFTTPSSTIGEETRF